MGCGSTRAKGTFSFVKKQYKYNSPDLARHIVSNKIAQQILQLEKRRNASVELKRAIAKLYEYRDRLSDEALDFQAVLGLEGVASRLYFSHMFDNIKWNGRTPRTKKDITNFLLDIGNMQLFHIIDAILNLYGFDTYKGVYHKEFYQRKSLVADIIEAFRPIVDYQIRN